MHIFLIIICIFITSLLPTKAYTAEWIKLGNVYVHDMVVKVYVDNETVQDDGLNNDYKSLWVKFELPKNLVSNIDKKEYRVRKEKYYYHCDQKLFAVSHLILLDRDEISIYDSGSFDPFSEEYSESWKLVTPKSGPALIYNYLCSKKTETASTEEQPVNLSKSDLLPKPIIIDETEDDKTGEKEVKSKNKKTEDKITKAEDSSELNVKKVRWAKHEDYERLVIDVYKGNDPADVTAEYKITKAEGTNKLKVELIGFTNSSPDFPGLEKSEFISKISKEKNQTDQAKNTLNINIDLSKPFKFKYFELENPGRIVIDISEE